MSVTQKQLLQGVDNLDQMRRWFEQHLTDATSRSELRELADIAGVLRRQIKETK